MDKARILVLAIAGCAGLAALYLASGSDDKPAPAPPVAQLPTVDILVAKTDIGLGQAVKPEDLQWQTWPAATASASFMRRDSNAEAIKEVTGSIARAPFIQGEPIREQKLVKADGSGFMAAILPTGMRRYRPKSHPRPAPAASSCRTTGSTSCCRSGTRIRTATAPTSSTPR